MAGRRALVGAIGFFSLMAGLLIASSSGWGSSGHQPGTLELIIQVGVLLAAFTLIAVRTTGKR